VGHGTNLCESNIFEMGDWILERV